MVGNPRGPGYPYTRLGYTYDWGVAANVPHYGASEFLVMPNSTATARAIIDTDAYCKAS